MCNSDYGKGNRGMGMMYLEEEERDGMFLQSEGMPTISSMADN